MDYFFDGLTDDDIARIAGVSLSTAYRWRTGRQKAPYAAAELLRLHSAGRIMPNGWERLEFKRGKLCTDTGHEFSAGEIEQYSLFMSFWRNASSENNKLRDYIEYLESVTPRATVLQFPADRARPSATLGHELNTLFDKT